MYRPPRFRLDDPALVDRLLDLHPFATLVAQVDGAPLVAHAPLYRHEGRLLGHLAAGNPLARRIDGLPLLALFTGPHGYVSPTWYGEPEAHVPTWNYLAVEVRGVAEVIPAAPLLAHLVARHEPDWRPDPALLAELAPAVVAFALTPSTVEAKAKLSQNRDPADRARVEARFAEVDPALAGWMRLLREREQT